MAARAAPRRYWLSTLTVILLLVFLSVFMLLFLNWAVRLPSLKKTWWFDWDYVSSLRPWRLWYKEDGAWLLFIFILGLITPLLELVSWIPCGPRPRWLGGRTPSPPATHLDPVNAAEAGARPATVAYKPLPRWRRRLVSLIPAWMLHLSFGAQVFLFLWTGVSVACWLLPYGFSYLYLGDTSEYGNGLSRPLVDEGETGRDTYTLRVISALGIMAGWPATMQLALVMIPTDRSSSWLAALNMSFEETNLFHRLFGWSFVFWTSVHGAFLHGAWAAVGYKNWHDFLWLDKYYNYQTAYFVASISWIVIVVIMVTSLEPVRKHCYNLFRIAHLLIWPMFPLVVMHIYDIYFWFSYALLLYAADLAQRWVLNSVTAGAVVTVADDNIVCMTIRLSSRHMRPTPDWAGKMVFLRVGRVSFWETHPMSIAAVDGSTITILFSVAGNWTAKLYELAKEAGPAGVEVSTNVEGPYGSDLASDMAGKDAVVFVAGGLGITPLASLVKKLMEQPMQTLTGRPLNVHILWVVRKSSVAAILPQRLLQRAACTEGFKVTVNTTSGPIEEVTEEQHPASVGRSSPSQDTPAKVPKLALPNAPSLDMPRSSTPSLFRVFLRRFLCKAVITWVATIAITAGYIIVSQIVYRAGGYMQTEERLDSLRAAYNASSLTTYYRSLNNIPPNVPLPAGASSVIAELEWPADQPLASDLYYEITEMILFGHAEWCLECSQARGPRPEDFVYGMEPFSCCTANIPMAWAIIRVWFPFFFALVLSIAAAIACRYVLARHMSKGTSSSYSLPSTPSTTAAGLQLTAMDKQCSVNVEEEQAAGAKLDAWKLTPPDGTMASPAEVVWRQGRPNLAADLSIIAADVAAAGGSRIGVYMCGPASMQDSLQKAVYHNFDLSGCTVSLHEFLFS